MRPADGSLKDSEDPKLTGRVIPLWYRCVQLQGRLCFHVRDECSCTATFEVHCEQGAGSTLRTSASACCCPALTCCPLCTSETGALYVPEETLSPSQVLGTPCNRVCTLWYRCRQHSSLVYQMRLLLLLPLLRLAILTQRQ